MAIPRPERLLSLFAACSVALGGIPAAAQSIRFFGTGAGDIDRVKIRIDDPATNVPGPPADVGAGDFTVEFWLRAPSGSNPAGAITCGANNDWINGNIVFDRDRYNQGRAYGISLGAGRVAFGIDTASGTERTICGSRDLRDNAWHHVAAQRDYSSGQMTVYVDGQPDASGTMPTNEDVSYPDNGVPGNFCGGPCTFSDPFIVLGAEKHDAGSQYPSFTGWLDEVRISTVVRYSSTFTPPPQPFTMGTGTAALYHFDESSGTDVLDENGNASSGFMSVGSNRPVRSTETPFSATPSPGTLALGASTYTVAEATPTVTLTVTRTNGASGAVNVNYSTSNGTATAGSDYTTTMGTLTWASGDAAAKSISVPVLDDAAFENSETFTVALDGLSVTGGATLGSPATATVTLTDNDVAPSAGTLELTAGTFAATEGAASVTVTLRRVNGSSGAVSVSYATTAVTATAGADYTTTMGTATWASGDSATKNIVVPLLDDAVFEPAEAFAVTLDGLSVTGGATLGRATATVTLTDDEPPPPAGVLELTADTFAATEGAASVAVTLQRVSGSAGAISVNYATTAVTATAGADYATTMGTATWASGDSATKNIVVPLLDDAVFEGTETFRVVLNSVTGGATLGRATATVTLTDNEPPPPAGVLELTADSFTAGEGAGTVTITARRTSGSSGTVSVAYATANGTATAGADYQGASGTLSWSDGETANKSFVVMLIDDALVEGAETITVTLSNVTGGAALGAQTTAQLSVNDDDSAGGGGALDLAALTMLLLAAGWQLLQRRLGTRIIS
jgi:hypothetical protein